MSKIADHLRRLREESGLSQSEFAAKMGVNRMTINNYETGKRIPDINFAVRAADFFDVTIEYICGRSEYRDREDIETSIKKAERLALAIGEMPQSEGQQLLSDLSQLLEYAHEQDADTPTLLGTITTVEGIRTIIAEFTHLRYTIVNSSVELMRRGLPPEMVKQNGIEKIAGLSDAVLRSSKSLYGTLEMVSSMLQKELEQSLDEVLKKSE